MVGFPSMILLPYPRSYCLRCASVAYCRSFSSWANAALYARPIGARRAVPCFSGGALNIVGESYKYYHLFLFAKKSPADADHRQGDALLLFVFQDALGLRRPPEGFHLFERQGFLSALFQLPDTALRMRCVLRAVEWNCRRRIPSHGNGFPLPHDRLCMCHFPHPFRVTYAHIIAHECRYGKSFVSKRRFSAI